MKDSQVSKSVRWTATSNVLRAAISFIQIVVLARVIPPSEFGVLAIVAAVQMFAASFSEAGISSAIIHFQNLTETQKSALFWWNMLASAVVYILVAALGYPLSQFYHNDRLTFLILISASVLVINAASQQLKALAERDMLFAPLAKIEIASSILGLVVSIAMAFSGFGIMSIIISQIAMAFMSSIMSWLFLSNGWLPSWHINARETLPFVRYGAGVLVVNILNLLISQIDIVILGRLVPPHLLGLYSQPRDLGLKIMTVINPVITRVGFPMMARHKHDKQSLARIYLKTMRMSASVSFPIFAALSLFSQEIVSIIYGSNWGGAVPYLKALSIWFLVRSVGNPLGGLLYAVGRTRVAFIQSVSLLAVMPIGVYLAASFDAKFVPLALITIHGFLIPIVWKFIIQPICGANLLRCVMQIIPPATSVVLTVAVIVALRTIFPITGPSSLVIYGAISAVVYLLMSLLLNREWIDEMVRLVSK